MTGASAEVAETRITGPVPVVPAQRTAADPGRRTGRGPAAALWPPERHAAVRLAHAHQTLAQLSRAGDPRGRDLGRRQVDVAETAARALLDRPPPDTSTGSGDPVEADIRAAQERGRAALARMLGPDPAAHAAAVTDVTRTWPADHLAVLRQWADHAGQQPRVEPSDTVRPATDSRGPVEQDVEQDAVAAARAAVEALPPTDQLADTDHGADDAAGEGPAAASSQVDDADRDAMGDPTREDSW